MKAISKNNTELRIIAPIVVILLGILISYILFKDQDVFKYLIPFLVLIAGLIWVYKRYTTSYNLFFNTTHLVLKNIKVEGKVALKDLKKLKLAHDTIRIFGFQYYKHTIDFKNETGLFETVSFYVWNMNASFSEFQDVIKAEFPTIKIEDFY